MIIALASLKGGAGKSTLSIHLAHAIALAKKRVLLVDADPQGSVSSWAAARDTAAPSLPLTLCWFRCNHPVTTFGLLVRL